MYSVKSFNGSGLPRKTLCVTYDDGPGKDSVEIAEFLRTQDVPATFFVVGKYAIHHTDQLKKIKDLGHLIANHTYDHPDMPFFISANGDGPSQILRTDAIIKNYIDDDTVYFRSPYGTWSAEVAKSLNQHPLSVLDHVGPIHWDIPGIDCYFWDLGRSVKEATDEYMKMIDEKKSGILVMHDEIADMDHVKPKNKTLELTMNLIPLLKTQGYNFIRLDQIPAIKLAASSLLIVNLEVSAGKYLILENDRIFQDGIKRKFNSLAQEFTIRSASNGKISIQAHNGMYLQVQNGVGQKVMADAIGVSETTVFDLIPLSGSEIILRASNGCFLSCTENGLCADAQYIRKASQFRVLHLGADSSKGISLKTRLSFLKRKILYVKSKLFPVE